MTPDQFIKVQTAYKNKITFLHNNLREGEKYSINGQIFVYEGYKATKQHDTAHVFKQDGRATPLILGKGELSTLDIFNDFKGLSNLK